jgi:hypothetical protein
MPFDVLLLLLLCYARLVVKCKKKKEKEKEIRLKYYPDGILSRITSRRVLSMEKKNGEKKKNRLVVIAKQYFFWTPNPRIPDKRKKRKTKNKNRPGSSSQISSLLMNQAGHVARHDAAAILPTQQLAGN